MKTIRSLLTKKHHGTFQAQIYYLGQLTPFSLAVPYSSPAEVSIGHIKFDVKLAPNGKRFAYPNAPLPASWFVDLSQDSDHEA